MSEQSANFWLIIEWCVNFNFAVWTTKNKLKKILRQKVLFNCFSGEKSLWKTSERKIHWSEKKKKNLCKVKFKYRLCRIINKVLRKTFLVRRQRNKIDKNFFPLGVISILNVESGVKARGKGKGNREKWNRGHKSLGIMIASTFY